MTPQLTRAVSKNKSATARKGLDASSGSCRARRSARELGEDATFPVFVVGSCEINDASVGVFAGAVCHAD